jgi:hypothetical protein
MCQVVGDIRLVSVGAGALALTHRPKVKTLPGIRAAGVTRIPAFPGPACGAWLVEDQRRDPDHREPGDEDDDAVPDEAPGSAGPPGKPPAGPACLVPVKRYDLTVAVPVSSVVMLVAPAHVMAPADMVGAPEAVPPE